HDLAAMRRAVTPGTRLVFIANPNNPTGTLVPARELEHFIAGLPRELLVVLDEAYNEYLLPENRSDTIGWLARFPNLVVTRTFSKVYGLAGLRVGYALAEAGVADLMNRVRQPFNVNSVALAAATAALEDAAFVRESFDLNQLGMHQLTDGFRRLEIEYIPSHGNFVSFRVKDAAGVYRKLLQAGVIVRPIASYGMPQHLRVTVGLESENARFLAALERALR
ncbi:MAG TPA: aminotransferase class I/II-fold pyridoxal phosphate-dependent enzyme, partial [Burkholderiales bacterium]|nr:aminotransferase class I/II-fold pyridoxal phosphate-dependent enzyme [Burkholderiales bacterium]